MRSLAQIQLSSELILSSKYCVLKKNLLEKSRIAEQLWVKQPQYANKIWQ